MRITRAAAEETIRRHIAEHIAHDNCENCGLEVEGQFTISYDRLEGLISDLTEFVLDTTYTPESV